MSKKTDKLIESIFNENFSNFSNIFKQTRTTFDLDPPKVNNIFQKDGKCVLEIDVPGVKREDIDVTVSGGELAVSYKDRHGKDHALKYNVKTEYSNVKANVADGVLSVTLFLLGTTRKVPVE